MAATALLNIFDQIMEAVDQKKIIADPTRFWQRVWNSQSFGFGIYALSLRESFLHNLTQVNRTKESILIPTGCKSGVS